jgi:oligosaccharide translocation protein RFT1
LRLGTSLFIQGVVKHVLTQGDVILISYLASLQAQGIYALASNYGGLIARMVFQPIEESSRNYFGKVLSSIDGAPPKSAIESANRDLHKLLRFYLLLSICAIAVGPTVAPICLRIIAGSKWTSSGAGEVLGKYCYYVPLLAVNGATEAFVSVVATESELNRQSLWMLVFSATFAGAGYLFLQVLGLGAEGLVWANVVNLAMRITWSLSYINNYFQHQGSRLDIMSILPNPATIATGAATAAILQQVQKQFDNSFRDLLVTGLIAGIFVVLL